MIGFLGYNFCRDGNALDPTPTDINNINYTRVQNGIFDHFNVSKNVEFDYSSIIPTYNLFYPTKKSYLLRYDFYIFNLPNVLLFHLNNLVLQLRNI